MNEIISNLASRGKRLGGAIIDGLFSIIIIVPIMFATGTMQQIISGQQMTISQQTVYFVLGWIVFLMLHGYLLYKKGQTIGKLIVKTRIVDMDGNILNFGKIIFLRYFLLSLPTQIPIIGTFVGGVNLLFIFGKQKRCLHDYLAGTKVIEI